jgi:hypothetical protein
MGEVEESIEVDGGEDWKEAEPVGDEVVGEFVAKEGVVASFMSESGEAVLEGTHEKDGECVGWGAGPEGPMSSDAERIEGDDRGENGRDR